jgi:hypothetical protein
VLSAWIPTSRYSTGIASGSSFSIPEVYPDGLWEAKRNGIHAA